MQASPVGICWYRPEDYARLMAMFTDRESLPDTYEEWLKEAKKVSGTLTLKGLHVVCFPLHVRPFALIVSPRTSTEGGLGPRRHPELRAILKTSSLPG